MTAANPQAYQETDYLREQIELVKLERAPGWDLMVKDLQMMIDKQEATKRLVTNQIGKSKQEEYQSGLDDVQSGFEGYARKLKAFRDESLEGKYTKIDEWLNMLALEEEKVDKAKQVKDEEEKKAK